MARKPEQSAPPSPAKKTTGAVIIWAFAVVIVVIFFRPIALVFIAAMLPSIGTFFVDKRPIKYATICVASMNFCGAFPSFMELWDGPNNINHALQIIGNILDLFIIYAAAAFGWLIYVAVPPVIGGMIAVVAQHRIAQLRGDQKELIQEWGEGIAEPSESLEKID